MSENGDGRIRIDKPRILLVEGDDDQEFFNVLANTLGFPDTIQVLQCKTVTKLRASLLAIEQASRETDAIEIVRLGIVRDADGPVQQALDSIRDALRAIGWAVPTTPLEVAQPNNQGPQVVVTFLPDNTATRGSLEDLCLKALQDDKGMMCVDQYFECLRENNIYRMRDSVVSKAKMRVFVTSRYEDRDFWPRIAFRRSWWPWDHAAFDQVKAFLQSLVSS